MNGRVQIHERNKLSSSRLLIKTRGFQIVTKFSPTSPNIRPRAMCSFRACRTTQNLFYNHKRKSCLPTTFREASTLSHLLHCELCGVHETRRWIVPTSTTTTTNSHVDVSFMWYVHINDGTRKTSEYPFCFLRTELLKHVRVKNNTSIFSWIRWPA